MRLLSFVILGLLVTAEAHSAPPTLSAGADGNSVAFKNGAIEAVTINSDGTVEASTPTANNHLTTKEYVDTQLASASGGGGLTCGFTNNYSGDLDGLSGANAKCVSDLGAGYTVAPSGLIINMPINITMDFWNVLSPKYSYNCNSWNSSSNSYYGTFSTYTTGSSLTLQSSGNTSSQCSNIRPIFCCKQ